MSLRVDQVMDPPQNDQECTSMSSAPPLGTSSSTTSTGTIPPSTDTTHHSTDNVATSRQYGKRQEDQNESLKQVDSHRYHSYNPDPRGDQEDGQGMSESDGESTKSMDSPTKRNGQLHTNTSRSSASPVRDGKLSSILRPPPMPQPTTDPQQHPSKPSPMYTTTTRPHGGSNRGLTTPTSSSLPPSTDFYGTIGQKRRFSDTYDHHSSFETRGSHGPRDELRYETWTSKQLRKKCSHLKLRGLKNVKKHVMVEALYRYHNTHPPEEEEETTEEGKGGGGGEHGRYVEERYHPMIMHRGRPTSTSTVPVTTTIHRSLKSNDMDQESKMDSFENEIRITSDDVIRLIDVMLSPDFVDRWISELPRWQFWVDVREKYLCKLKEETSSQNEKDRASLMSYSRNTRWSSMQLWEMWKGLTFAYTKTCFEFTTAGMRSANECDYLYYCEGRPDVYYLHQRLHSRPDLLHLIKSNEYIEEKESGSGSSGQETTAAANALMKVVGSPRTSHSHKRFKRLMPTNSSTSSNNSSTSTNGLPSGTHRYNGKEIESSTLPAMDNASNSNGLEKNSATKKRSSDVEGPLTNGLSSEGSTENSETIEETSLDKTNSNSSRGSSQRSQPCGEELTEQKYFGLLLQNFEAIFESLHNKKILLAALRKDKSAPDHLIADLHDDIHVLSALKKEFRNKLRQTLE